MSESKEADEHERDMLNMFASVWVKVEVNEEDADMISYDNPLDNNVRSFKKNKKNRRQLTKTLKCETCEYTTVYKNCLELHILGHNNLKPLSCDTCNYKTRYPTSLTRHMLIQHQFKKTDHDKGAPLHKCDDCTYTSYFKWNLNAHKRKHKLEKQFKCELCSYSTAYKHNYIKHSKVHNKQEVIYKCDKCPFVTKFEGHISRHLAKIHNEVSDQANKCDVCDFSTKLRWRLNVHKQKSKQNSVLKCLHCEFETTYMCESKKHKVTHYSEIYGTRKNENVVNNEEIYGSKQNENEEIYGLKQNENEEIYGPKQDENEEIYGPKQDENIENNVNQEMNLGVPVFEPLSDTETDLPKKSTHEKTNHYILDPNCEVDWHSIQVIEPSNKGQPFQCIMCKYTSRFKASVQRHFQRHHTGSQNRPYKCCNCDFSTKTKDQIALHNKRSQSEVQLLCKECEFATSFKCQFVMHQKCHYSHKCTVCSYTCKHKYEIQKHFTTMHLGNGLKCRFCDYKASRKESLLCHETIHTGNKPFKCSYCGYNSVRKSLLDNHMKRYHSEIKKDIVVVSDSKIHSLKIPIGEKHRNQDLIQEIRDHNLSIEDILNSQNINTELD